MHKTNLSNKLKLFIWVMGLLESQCLYKFGQDVYDEEVNFFFEQGNVAYQIVGEDE